MLGKITLPGGVIAELTDDGMWKCRDKELEQYLNISFSLDGKYGSPAMGAPGGIALHDAAESLGGKAEYLGKEEPYDPEAVY